MSPQIRDQRVRDGLRATDGDRPAHRMRQRRQHQARARGHQRRHPRDRVCRNAGEQGPGVLTGQSAPRRAALEEQARRDPQGRGDARRDRTLVAEQQPDHAVRCPPTADPAAAATTRRRRVRHRCERYRGSRSRRHGPAAGCRTTRRVLPASHPARADRTLRRTATPVPAGARPSRCHVTPPGTPGPGRVRAPPPAVDWASMT